MISDKIRLGITATGISFMGTLPLGTLNISIANLMFHRDTEGAIAFAFAAVAVEMLTVRLALTIVDRLRILKNYYWLLRLLSVTILFILSIATFIAASRAEQFSVAFPLTDKNPFIAGLTLSALNPLHIPFWMGWTVVLKNRGILSEEPSAYNLFVLSIGSGTITAFGVYGLAGRFLIQLLGHWQSVLYWILGAMLLFTAIVQLYKALSSSRKTKQRRRVIT